VMRDRPPPTLPFTQDPLCRPGAILGGMRKIVLVMWSGVPPRRSPYRSYLN
jgi:hypothetical protein